MSKITGLRTVRLAERSNLIWVELATDEGLTGLGETFRGAAAIETVLHDQIAPWLIGRDARRIEAISRHLLTPYLGYHSASAEVRAASAIDIALWDLAGKRHAIPVHSTNRIPPNVSRSPSRFRPGYRNRLVVVGNSGSNSCHNPSGTSHGLEVAISIPFSLTTDADGFASHDRVPSF